MKWILGAILVILAIGIAGMLLPEITVIHVTTISDRNYLKISSPLLLSRPGWMSKRTEPTLARP